MGRYVYDSDKVNETLSQLNTAKGKLSSTSSEFSSALNEIINASKGYLEVDTSTLPSIPEEVKSSIEELSKMISDKQQEIEEYNKLPAYKKFFATLGMVGTKIGEGILTAGEQLIDAGATIVGWGCGAVDILAGTNSQESVTKFIEKDHIGDLFADQYENGILKGINDSSIFSHTSTAANVFKGIGVATGYVIAAGATGGIGGLMSGTGAAAGASAAIGSIGVNTTIAGLAGLGSGTQSGLEQGLSFGDASIQGVKQGAIQGATVFVAGKVAQKLTKPKSSTELSVVDDTAKITTKTSDNIPKLQGNTTQTPRLPGEVSIESGVMRDSAGNVFKTTQNVAFKATDNVDEVINKALGIADETSNMANGNMVVDILDESGNVIGQTTAKTINPTSKITNATFMKDGKMYTTSTGHTIRDSGRILQNRLQSGINDGFSTVKNIASNLGTELKTVGTAALNSGKVTLGTVATSPATATLVASTYNQAKAQNASQQFKNSVDPSNHVALNIDTSESIASVSEGPFESKEQEKTKEDVGSNVQTGNLENNNMSSVENNANNSGGNTIQARVTNPTSTSSSNIDTTVNSQSTTDTTIQNPENNSTVETPTENPTPPNSSETNNSQSGNTNNNASGNTSVDEEVIVPETPSSNNNGNNNVTIGNGGSTGSAIGGSNIGNNNSNLGYTNGGRNNYTTNNNYGNGYGQSGELSYENKPGVEISGEESEIVGIDESNKGNTLDVISIDKESGNASVSTGSNDGGSVIPTILGVGTAAGAGVAGIHYIKKKTDSQDDEYYEEETFDDNKNVYLENYNESNSKNTDYSEETIAQPQKYKAGTMNQLALDDGTNIMIDEDSNIIIPQKEELE